MYARYFRRLAVASVLVFGLGVLSACAGARMTDSVVPGEGPGSPPAQVAGLLAGYGYTPVAGWYQDGNFIGHVFAVCPDGFDATDCGNGMHDTATHSRPNLYVRADGSLEMLEGPHPHAYDDRNFLVAVPPGVRDVSRVTPERMMEILGLTVDASSDPRSSLSSYDRVIDSPLGDVRAWLARIPNA